MKVLTMRNSIKHTALAIAALTMCGNEQVLAVDNQSAISNEHATFQWPETDPQVIPDARLNELVKEARDAADRAKVLAGDAEELANTFGQELKENQYQAQTISEGVIFTGRNAPHAGLFPDNVYVGKMTYGHGASAIGAFEFITFPRHSTWGTGVARASVNSPISRFAGKLAAPGDIRTRPAEGVTQFRNGDTFTGLYYLYFHDTDALGVYEDATEKRRFVGQLQTVGNMLQPKKGIVEDDSGNLIAVFLY